MEQLRPNAFQQQRARAGMHYAQYAELDPRHLPAGLREIWGDTELAIADHELFAAWDQGLVTYGLALTFIQEERQRRQRRQISQGVASDADATLNESL